MGRWQGKIDNEQRPIVEPKRSGFREVEQIDLAEGWMQMVAGRWRGIGLLEVLEEQHIWGRQVLIVEPGRDRDKLQEHYPGLMVFTPAEFRDVVEHWPENEGVVFLNTNAVNILRTACPNVRLAFGGSLHIVGVVPGKNFCTAAFCFLERHTVRKPDTVVTLP